MITSAIFSTSEAFATPYGTDVTTIACAPRLRSSISYSALSFSVPCPDS